METNVSEIHRYPLRPDRFEEPLFPTPESKRAVAEHLLRASWLSRASEMEGKGGQAVHFRRESVEVENSFAGGRAWVLWASGKRRVVEVLDRWREVASWWDEARATDRTIVRVLLSDGAVVDLARECSGWFLVGVVD